MALSARTKIKRLVDQMDQDAENSNAHDFVITHRALAVLMADVIGHDATLQVFEAIAKESGGDGIHGLTGVAGAGPDTEYLARRGISTNWADWEMPRYRHA